MANTTEIQWCDSVVNGEMGCDGCELLNVSCYAQQLTERFKGQKGFPASFTKPELFPERIPPACRWRDMAGKPRPGKPWIDPALPRIIFLNDMGDTFTESLPLHWLDPYIPMMAEAPHIWIMLTKRPRRMAQFWAEYGPVPGNFWLCTTVTLAATLPRIRDLQTIIDAPVLGVSLEPLLEEIRFPDLTGISWVKIGGESGSRARPCDLRWIRSARDQFLDAGAAVFVKQMGATVTEDGKPRRFRDGHGGDWSEFPEDLKVRQMPVRETAPAGCLF